MTDIIHKITSLKHGAFVRVKYRTDVQPLQNSKTTRFTRLWRQR